MQVIYAKQNLPNSWSKAIFLAGPTPRSMEVPSWRPAAIAYLESIGYDGVVFSPEPEDGVWLSGGDAYANQVAWERQGLDMADVIVFWVPRNRDTMLGLTTNVEFGRYVTSGKIVFGAPAEADSVRYLETMLSSDVGAPRTFTLESTLDAAVAKCGIGVMRSFGERYVPLHIWNQRFFQEWYESLLNSGNALDSARVVFQDPLSDTDPVFCWALKVKIWIAEEGRFKENEFVFTRSDISCVVLYHLEPDFLDTKIVFVKEFRSPVRNEAGYVYELPGGSSKDPTENPLEIAAHEVHEETGMIIHPSRFRKHTSQQMVATLSSHHATLYSAEITNVELAQAESLARAQTTHGVEEDTERTYVCVYTLREVMQKPLFDWSTLGMVFKSLLG